MQKKINRMLNHHLMTVHKDRTLSGVTRLWIASAKLDEAALKKIDYNWRNFDDTIIDAIPVLPLTELFAGDNKKKA